VVANLRQSEGSFDDELVQDAYLGVQGVYIYKPGAIFLKTGVSVV